MKRKAFIFVVAIITVSQCFCVDVINFQGKNITDAIDHQAQNIVFQLMKLREILLDTNEKLDQINRALDMIGEMMAHGK